MNTGTDEDSFLKNREKLIFGYKPSEWLFNENEQKVMLTKLRKSLLKRESTLKLPDI